MNSEKISIKLKEIKEMLEMTENNNCIDTEYISNIIEPFKIRMKRTHPKKSENINSFSMSDITDNTNSYEFTDEIDEIIPHIENNNCDVIFNNIINEIETITIPNDLSTTKI